MGIAIHNVSVGNDTDSKSINLSAALRRDAGGLFGTTVEYGELGSHLFCSTSILLSSFLFFLFFYIGYPICCRRIFVHRRCGGITHVSLFEIRNQILNIYGDN